MKLKHGTRVIAYQASDYSKYNHAENYIHPTITIQSAVITDAMEEYRAYGSDYYLENAKKLREATRDTFYVALGGSFGKQLTFRWQSDRRYNDGLAGYGPLYACGIQDCGFDLPSLTIAIKIAKLATNAWSSQPLEIVEALKKLKAVNCAYDRNADEHLIIDHLADNMFGLPDIYRQRDQVEV